MNLLLDTHILLWAAADPAKLSSETTNLISNKDNRLYFSAASIWEVVIKNGLHRPDFFVDPHILRRGLVDNGYLELPISTQHTLALSHLPDIHKDPFDRMLIAQAVSDRLNLMSDDSKFLYYDCPII